MRLPLLGSVPSAFRSGAGAAPLLNRARGGQVRLQRVRWQRGGCRATVSRCRAPRRLENRAGRRLDACRDRPPRPGKAHGRHRRPAPGWPQGHVLFLLLVRALGGFIWCIRRWRVDPGLHKPAMQPGFWRLRHS